MADVVDTATRSRMMSGIRRRNTRIEVSVRKALHARGFRYRVDDRRLPGRPDIVLPRWNAVVLIHGCFWHSHDCGLCRIPSTRPDFWREKLAGNAARDERSRQTLLDRGWRVAVVWECETKDERTLAKKLQNLMKRTRVEDLRQPKLRLRERIRGS
jgi:DNA mismatch endonuclease (patch repair protein)